MTSPAASARSRYQSQIDQYSDRFEQCKVLDRQIALVRGVLFICLIAGIVGLFWQWNYRALGGLMATVAFLALLFAAIYHLRVFRRQIEAFERM
jgi:hypothetical protein